MSEPVKQFLRLLLFVGVQVLVLNNIPPLHRTISPYVYYTFILWLPFSLQGPWLLVLGFITGFLVDIFTKTPGLFASSALWVAYLRQPLIRLMVPKDTRELKTGSPGIHAMGFTAYLLFATILTFCHHGWLVFIEWMQFGNFWYFLQKVVLSSLVSLLLILIAEILFRPTRKRRIG